MRGARLCRRLAVSGIWLITFALLGAPVAAQEPIEERIVLQCGLGQGDICIMKTDGTDRGFLTFDSTYDIYPSLSPDGRQIVWRRDFTEIWIMNVDGSNLHPATTQIRIFEQPSWATDGEWIIASCDRMAICAVQADGNEVRTIASPGYPVADPRWSPDGTRIAFTAYANGIAQERDVLVMNADGSNIVNLTNTADVRDRQPAWSPDGTLIAFASTRAPSVIEGIWVMNADGSNPRLVASPDVGGSSPTWSLDGRQIVFACLDDLCVVNLDGTGRPPTRAAPRRSTPRTGAATSRPHHRRPTKTRTRKWNRRGNPRSARAPSA